MHHSASFVAADWSKGPKKRSVHVADLEARRIHHEERPDWSLESLLGLARDLRASGPVLVGLDVVLGVPAGYWAQAIEQDRWRGASSFLDWLETLDPASDFFETVNEPQAWQVDRPFFRVPPGTGSLSAFQNRVEGRLLRRLDISTQGKPMFAVSGIPGTVGSGTRALWQELIPLLQETRDFAVWPFDGELELLLALQRIVLAETYPGLAYAAALAAELPTGRISISKAKREARERACELLEEAAWVREGGVDLGDLGPARRDEDAFDSHFTAAAVLRCVIEDLPLCDRQWIEPSVEGGMLPAGPVDPARPTKWLSARSGAPGGAQPGHGRRRSQTRASPRDHPCPIGGCSKVFRGGRGGWDGHVGSARMHPAWQPGVTDPEERKRRFLEEFGEWFQ